MTSTVSDRAFATFAELHSATMLPIYFSGASWPGFSYSDEEQAEMRDVFRRSPNATGHLYLCLVVIVPIILSLIVISVLLMFWIITVIDHTRGRTLPTLLFCAIFGSTMAVNLAILFPLGYYLSCIVCSFFVHPALEQAPFGRRLFFKYCRQLTRVALIFGFGCLLLSLWPAYPSTPSPTSVATSAPVSIWLRFPIPLAAICLKVMTLCFYYRQGRELEKRMRAAYAADDAGSA